MLENRKMRILSAIGIILIVAGHFELDYLTLGGLFPYYSFHVYIFLFVAGYFYSPDVEEHCGKYILKKAKNLLLPYFAWNLVYGVISTILNNYGFGIGQNLSVKTFLLDPFLGGHQFMFNFSAWFVPALFLVELINVVSRKVLSLVFGKCSLKNRIALIDMIMFFGSLIIGTATVYLAITGHVWGEWKTPGRLLIMLPGLCFGRAYKLWIEPIFENKIIPKAGRFGFYILYFGILTAFQFLLIHFTENLSFSTVWCTGFASGCIGPFLSVMTGIMFWIGVADIIAASKSGIVRGLSNCLVKIGRSTFGIMMHHIPVLFVINSVCFFLFKSEFGCLDFNASEYLTNVSYQYLYAGYHLTHIINLILAVGIPTLIYSRQKQHRKANV